MEKIQLKIQYSKEDLQNSYRLHNKGRNFIKGKLLLILGAVLILAGILIQVIMYNPDKKIWLGWLFSGLGIYVIFRYFWKEKRQEKQAIQEMEEFHSQPFTFSISKKGIDVKGNNINAKTSWQNYIKSIITADLILLYPSKEGFSIFPRKYFKPSEYYQFLKWVNENVKI